MNIKTKFNIGDIVKYDHVTTYSGKKNEERSARVGIIEKILYSKKGISYLMETTQQGWVEEKDITHTLIEAEIK